MTFPTKPNKSRRSCASASKCLNDIWDRDTDITTQQWTKDKPDGERYGGKKPLTPPHGVIVSLFGTVFHRQLPLSPSRI
jgi:hypothetical protein